MAQDDISKIMIQNNYFNIKYSKCVYYKFDGNLYTMPQT